MSKITKEDAALLENLIDKYGRDQLLQEMKLPTRSKLGTLLGAGLIAGATLFGVGSTEKDKKDVEPKQEPSSEMVYNNPYGIPNVDYDLIKEKQKMVKLYISDVLGKQGKSLDDLKFNPDNLVLACYLYDYDLPLLLAQLQIESHFGTTNRARRTNSMFSVGAYDNGTDAIKYKDQDSSIIPYIQLINKNYLLNGKKDVEDLLKNFVNGSGKRYATNPQYETFLRQTRNSIMSKYPELMDNYSCDA